MTHVMWARGESLQRGWYLVVRLDANEETVTSRSTRGPVLPDATASLRVDALHWAQTTAEIE